MTDHKLDITKAVCKVSFDIKVGYEMKAEGAEEGAKTEGEAALKTGHMALTLGASLLKKADRSVEASPNSYPFQKPIALLKS
eukprot:9650754-Ditylum_brightwellii.AAC.1